MASHRGRHDWSDLAAAGTAPHCASVMSSWSHGPMDHSPSDSSVHGIIQARILEWVAISFSRDSADPVIELMSPALQADSLLLSHQWSPIIIINNDLFLPWANLETCRYQMIWDAFCILNICGHKYWKSCVCVYTPGFRHSAILCFSRVQLKSWSHGPQPARLLCPWGSPGKNTGMGLLQGSSRPRDWTHVS